MAEEKYIFEDEDKEVKTKLEGFLEFIWNTKTREFCGRDGASWAKVSLFYGVFYLVLGGFFIGMLTVFFYVTPKDKPTYYGISSMMNARGINPGLGFRPQINPEDQVIKYDPTVQVEAEYGLQQYSENLRIFLHEKYIYDVTDLPNLVDCSDSDSSETLAASNKSCRFDYEKIFKSTHCTKENSFGYKTNKPCVLVKLNKIISWKPETKNTYVSIKCAGENAFDADNLRNVTYHSENSLSNNLEGQLPLKYFPFMAQKSYRSPFVWVEVDVTPNVLVNIECRAYAENIDHERLNRRGLTRFTVFVKKGLKREL